ncbi:MAG: DUF2922 domain-containing protein [Thermacetogeniaceae bacterium]
MLTRTLVLIFQTAGGGRLRISIPDPKPDLTAQEVNAAMNAVLAKNIFATSTGNATAILGAQIVSRETTDVISV